MDGIFSVDDEIDFSDDDIDFNKRKDKQMYTSVEEDIPDTVPVSINESNRSLLHDERPCKSRDNIFKHRRNSNNSYNIKSPSTMSYSSTFIGNQSDDIILNDFLNTDTDELLSQIDMPSNDSDNCKHTIEKQKTKDNREKMNSINNEIYSQLQTFQRKDSSQSSRSNVDIGRSWPENHLKHSKQAFQITGKNPTQNIPIPFCNKKVDQDICMQPHQAIRSCEQVTPIKHGSGKCRASKRTYSDSCEKNSVNPSSSKQRRFPGPAGLLPSINNFTCLDKLKSPEQCQGKRTLTPITPKTPIQSILTSSQDEDFKQTIWSDVQTQVSKLFPSTNCEIISKILQKATMNQLNNGKVSLLCGLIKSVCNSGSGGKLVLKDHTGEINGTVHKNVLEEYESDLSQGSGLILKDISVFSPTLKKHYINITPSNIVQIFPAEFPNIMPSQLQCTQLSENTDTDKDNVTHSIAVEQAGNVICEDSGNNLNEKDIFGNEENLDHFFSDDLCVV